MEIKESKSNNQIKLRGLKNMNDKLLDTKNSVVPRNVFFQILAGGPGSGKTSLINVLMREYKGLFEKIYFLTGSIQTLPEPFLNKFNSKRVFTEINTELIEQIYNKNKETQTPTLLIIDDLIADIDKDKELKKTLKKVIFNRRHVPIYIILITQRWREIPLSLRKADNIFFWNFNDKRESEALFNDAINDIDEKQWKALQKYLIKNNESKHDFLYINKYNNKYYRNFNKLEFTDGEK